MKIARIAVLGVALAAGGLAALLAGHIGSREPETIIVESSAPSIETVEVLVAAADISLGNVVSSSDLVWRQWPRDDGARGFIQRDSRPDATDEIIGAVARMPFYAGEPIREEKLVKTDGSGFMSAILPSGMRAISTEISPETGAGGFILPNDRVDVILTRRDAEAERSGRQVYLSETILTNVRVLAIDQTLGERDGQRVVVGRTATMELGAEQSEILALARQLGTLHLALRSLTDSRPSEDTPQTVERDRQRRPVTTFVRYGQTSETGR